VDSDLVRRLRAVGIDVVAAVHDPGEAWRTLLERSDQEATLSDRYRLEAAALGVAPADLPPETRERLGVEWAALHFPGLELIGKPSGAPIKVTEYRAAWREVYAEWRERLALALGATAQRIEHVGSTAVPDLVAKPIVDIQVSVIDLAREAEYVGAIEATGVRLRSRHREARYFRPRPGDARVVHVHVCEAGGGWERDHLLFRDFLRADAESRDAYGALKVRLADEHAHDRIAYTEAKSPFIREATKRAEAWARRVGWRP
jgi:GrpB-like predicted nucleotidyltransferase (UPF0157 family)